METHLMEEEPPWLKASTPDPVGVAIPVAAQAPAWPAWTAPPTHYTPAPTVTAPPPSPATVAHVRYPQYACSCGTVRLPGCLGGEATRVPVRVHALLVFLPLVRVYSVFRSGAGFAAFALALFGSAGAVAAVLVAEMGHLAAAARFGQKPICIVLWPLGGFGTTARAGSTHCQQIAISIAGLATFIPMGVFWLLLWVVSSPASRQCNSPPCWLDIDRFGDWVAMLFAEQFITNASLFVFNGLIPCYPLACSTIIMNALAMLGVTRRRAAIGIAAVSVPIICLMAGFGIYDLFTPDALIEVDTAEYKFYFHANAFQTLCVSAWLALQTLVLFLAIKEERLDAHALFVNAPNKEAHVSTVNPMGLEYGQLGVSPQSRYPHPEYRQTPTGA